MSTVPERRKNLPLRELVAKAYLIIEPFFDPANAPPHGRRRINHALNRPDFKRHYFKLRLKYPQFFWPVFNRVDQN